MQHLGKAMAHHRLILRMGQIVGLDIVAGHKDGRLTQQDWADMVQRCQGCEWACKCKDWMARNTSADTAPDTCPNRERFASLRVLEQQDCR